MTPVSQMPGKVIADVERRRRARSAHRAAPARRARRTRGPRYCPAAQTSGNASPANAVSSFSCAAVHGSCCSSTWMPGLRAFEFRQQLGDDFAFAAHRPEAHDFAAVIAFASAASATTASAAACPRQQRAHEAQPGFVRSSVWRVARRLLSSHPPVKPARSSPRGYADCGASRARRNRCGSSRSSARSGPGRCRGNRSSTQPMPGDDLAVLQLASS